MMKTKINNKLNNLVAKFMGQFNKPKKEVDKKKRDKVGYVKHKQEIME